jgi:acylglycerol lipase
MQHIEGTFKGTCNVPIYYQAWIPEGEVKAILLIVHGLGEHCGRYTNVVDHFLPLNYAIYGLDHVGHGKSGGEREFIKSFDDYTCTLHEYYDLVKSKNPNSPIFLLGHSMGGLVVSYYLLTYQSDIKGAVISAPFVKIPDSISRTTIALAKVLSVIAPKAGIQKLDATGVSRSPEVVEAYISDPLVFHGKTPARWGGESLKAMLYVTEHADQIKQPFIVLQGEADRLVDPDGAKMLYEKASSDDKTLKTYPGLYHEVFNEPEREQVLRDVESWLSARLV